MMNLISIAMILQSNYEFTSNEIDFESLTWEVSKCTKHYSSGL